MVNLYDLVTNAYLGQIPESDLRFLNENLEIEDPDGQDYYIDRVTLELLKERGMSQDLADLLDKAVGTADGIEIRYEPVE